MFDVGECKEYYEDPWIFGEEEEAEDSAEDEGGEADESGSGEGSGGEVGEKICITIFLITIFSTYISNEKCQLSINIELDEKMTKEELQDLFGEKRCKPEPVEPCADSKHGCCPDNFHSAKGPFFEGRL